MSWMKKICKDIKIYFDYSWKRRGLEPFEYDRIMGITSVAPSSEEVDDREVTDEEVNPPDVSFEGVFGGLSWGGLGNSPSEEVFFWSAQNSLSKSLRALS